MLAAMIFSTIGFAIMLIISLIFWVRREVISWIVITSIALGALITNAFHVIMNVIAQ